MILEGVTTAEPERQQAVTVDHAQPQVIQQHLSDSLISLYAVGTPEQSAFRPGSIKSHWHQWQTLTSDKFILQSVSGVTIDFDIFNLACTDV